jgi:hypothetical protein
MGEVIEFPARRRGRAPSAATYTIKDVADACGLPQPVIAQLVSRTWTAAGWMYTAEQLQEAVDQAEAVRTSAGGTDAVPGKPMTVSERIGAARSLHPSAGPVHPTPR